VSFSAFRRAFRQSFRQAFQRVALALGALPGTTQSWRCSLAVHHLVEVALCGAQSRPEMNPFVMKLCSFRSSSHVNDAKNDENTDEGDENPEWCLVLARLYMFVQDVLDSCLLSWFLSRNHLRKLRLGFPRLLGVKVVLVIVRAHASTVYFACAKKERHVTVKCHVESVQRTSGCVRVHAAVLVGAIAASCRRFQRTASLADGNVERVRYANDTGFGRGSIAFDGWVCQLFSFDADDFVWNASD
jgi:hypothetical protein